MKRWLSWVHIISSTFFQVVDIELSGHERDKPLISCDTTVIIIMKLNLFNTVKNEERGRGQQSGHLAQVQLALLHYLNVLSTTFSRRALSLFSLWNILLPPSLPRFIFPKELGTCHTDKSVWQVPSSIGVGAHGEA